jgi:hypothetical protein
LVWSEVIYMNKNVVLTFFLELKITHTWGYVWHLSGVSCWPWRKNITDQLTVIYNLYLRSLTGLHLSRRGYITSSS